MRVRLNSRAGRVVRQFAAHVPDPEAVEDEPVAAEAEAEAEESAASRWDRLIAEIDEGEPEQPPPPIVAAGTESSFAILRMAAEELEQGRQRELASRAREREVMEARARQDRGVMREVLAALSSFASRPAGDTHISLPATELHPHVTIHEPAITVEPAEVHAPDVNVTVEAPEIPAPVVTVQAAAPTPVEVRPEITVEASKAPDVHVTVQAPPRPAPSAIRLEVGDDGVRRFVPEDGDTELDRE